MNMDLEDLRHLPDSELSDLYDRQEDGSEAQELIEEAMHSYHYCDVCGAHYPIDEPCEFH